MTSETPTFDTILSDQKLSERKKFLLKAMLGRCLHAPGDLDDWKAVLFLTGRSQTGKSLIIGLMRDMFNDEDVGMWVSCPEVPRPPHDKNKKVWLSSSIGYRFQISPEKLITKKDGSSYGHSAIAGNCLPWAWTSKSIKKHVIVIRFSEKVNVNEDYPDRLARERSAIRKEIDCCYMQAGHMLQGQDIMSSDLVA